MPELPEVETVVSDLNQKIVGDTIVDFWSDWTKTIKNLSLKKFKRDIRNRKILRARRIGKNIFIDLSGGKTLYIHLKMTGHLLIKSEILNPKSLPEMLRISKQAGETNSKSKNQKTTNYSLSTTNYFNDRVNQYIHHIWKLKSCSMKHKTCSKKTLEFSDMRKFAKIVLDDTEKINNLPEIKKLGVDAMSREFTLKKFQEIISKKSVSRRSKPIGIILMEQELIAGIGNIYRSEILFESRISPLRKSGKITKKEAKKLYQSIQKVLKKAIRMRGTSDSDYRVTAGMAGNFQKVLQVYRKDKKVCLNCGIIIKRLKLGQRNAFFCPQCQK